MTVTSTGSLTENYREYMRLHYLARKTKEGIMPKAEILESIHEVSQKMTDFEKEHAEWVNSLYAQNIDIKKIKDQIKVLAKHFAYLKQNNKEMSRKGEYIPVKVPEEVEACKPADTKSRYWNKDIRFAQLCALRAAMRGRVHFHTTTRQDTLDFYGIAGKDARSQMHWVEETAKEFCHERPA